MLRINSPPLYSSRRLAWYIINYLYQRLHLSWIGKDDGLLIGDINNNGLIDNGSELFGNKSKSNNHYSYTNPNAKDGFEALKEPDSNNDGIISNLDENFDKLQIWQDSNSNGVSETNELKSLSELGIESLNLNKFTNLNLLVA